jgi:O-antigen/teichoic acid export membrane protein
VKVSQKKAGVIISYATEAVKILTSLLYTPIMLRILGSSEYGLYQLVHSVVAYLGLLSLGFGAAYMRFYSRSKAKGDETEIAKLNGMFLTIFSIISIVCCVCGAVMVANIKTIFSTGLTESELAKAKILMIFMVVNLALTFPNTVFNNCVTAHERFIFQKTLHFLQALFNPFLGLPLLLMGYGSVGIVLLSTGLTVAVLISNCFYCLKKLKIRFLFKGFQRGLFNEMFAFTFFLFLNQIIDQINWSVDKFLLGRMINTTAVAIYSTGALLNSLYIQLSKSISNVFVPQINRIVAEDNDDVKLTRIFTRVGRMQFALLALIMTGIIFFGQSFIKMWAVKGYDNAYYVALLLVIPETIPLIQNIGIEVQRAKNKHKVRSVVYFFMAIANIFISIPLIRSKGEIGAALGTTISLLCANILFMNWYYHKKIGLNMIYFWKNIGSMVKGIIIPAILGTYILLYVNTNGILRFSVFVGIYSIIYIISMWLLGLNEEEKQMVSSTFKRMKKLFRK